MSVPDPVNGGAYSMAEHDGRTSQNARFSASFSFNLVEHDGTFQNARLNDFVATNKLADIGPSYAVVASMGPTGSGKSTLLNGLFDTQFPVSDASSGRNKTTKGVGLARAKNIEPCLLVLDLEGTDGIERKGDTAFEWQTALLALAVSDVVLINMWCNDIGRDNGASVPLLKLVFQAVKNLKSQMKTTLLIVVRDNLKSTSEADLEAQLIGGLDKIWKSVQGSSSNDKLADFFDVKVTFFSHYELAKEDFQKQVTALSERFRTSIAQKEPQAKDLLDSRRRATVLGKGFSETASFIWETIRTNKNLDLRSLQVTISNTRLKEVAQTKSFEFQSHKDWKEITSGAKNARQNGVVTGFGSKVQNLIKESISSFNQEVSHFDETTKRSHRVLLERELRENVLTTYQQMLSQQTDKAITEFGRALASSSNTDGFAVTVRKIKRNVFDSFEKSLTDTRVDEYFDYGREESQFRERLLREMDLQVSSKRDEKIKSFRLSEEKTVTGSIVEFTRTSLTSATKDTWLTIRRQVQQAVQSAQTSLRFHLTDYELDDATQNSSCRHLETFASDTVEKVAREEATQALQRLRERFQTIFGRFNPNESTRREDPIQTAAECEMLAEQARSSALKILSVLAVIRLDDKSYHVVEQTLASLLLGHKELTHSTELTARSWSGIPSKQTILSPAQCFSIWREFYVGTESKISEVLTPLHKVVTTTRDTNSFTSQHSRLTEVVKIKVSEFKRDTEWNEITQTAKTGDVFGWGKRVQDLLLKYISSFEEESSHVDEKTITSHRVTLEREAQEIVLPIYRQVLRRQYDIAVTTFDREVRKWAASSSSDVIFPVAVRQLKRKVFVNFDKSLIETRIDYIDHEREESKFREELLRQIDVLVSSVRDEQTRVVVSSQKEELESGFVEFTRTSLRYATSDTWSKIQHRLEEVVQSAQSSLRFRLAAYELDETTHNSFFEEFHTFGIKIVTKEAKREASQAIQYLRERFESVFGRFNQGTSINRQDPIQAIAEGEILAEKGRSSALKVLAVLAVIQLNGSLSYGNACNPVEQILSALLLRGKKLTANSWQGIPPEQTLLSPLQCSNIWTEFLSEIDRIVEDALAPLQGILPRPGPGYGASRISNFNNEDEISAGGGHEKGGFPTNIRPELRNGHVHGGTGDIKGVVSTPWTYYSGPELRNGGLPQANGSDYKPFNGVTKESPAVVGLGEGGFLQNDGADYTRFDRPQQDDIRTVVRSPEKPAGGFRPTNGSDYTRFDGLQQDDIRTVTHSPEKPAGGFRPTNGSDYTRFDGLQQDDIRTVIRSPEKPAGGFRPTNGSDYTRFDGLQQDDSPAVVRGPEKPAGALKPTDWTYSISFDGQQQDDRRAVVRGPEKPTGGRGQKGGSDYTRVNAPQEDDIHAVRRDEVKEVLDDSAHALGSAKKGPMAVGNGNTNEGNARVPQGRGPFGIFV